MLIIAKSEVLMFILPEIHAFAMLFINHTTKPAALVCSIVTAKFAEVRTNVKRKGAKTQRRKGKGFVDCDSRLV